ncbi:MAG: XRE family transcriptional regulator, partial [Candidatus Electrothrix sp. AR3]|nr:XRE family transcriptional regulator [Candidatus Electrothrix sp. AR3]
MTHHSSSPQTIAVNGPKIKQLRMAKKLTQLYVATECGVAVETVSNWERNSPNIKLENAEKLATILESSIEAISKPLPDIVGDPDKSWWKIQWSIALLLILLLAGILYSIWPPPPPPPPEDKNLGGKLSTRTTPARGKMEAARYLP